MQLVFYVIRKNTKIPFEKLLTKVNDKKLCSQVKQNESFFFFFFKSLALYLYVMQIWTLIVELNKNEAMR